MNYSSAVRNTVRMPSFLLRALLALAVLLGGCAPSPPGSCRLAINGNNVCIDCVGPNLDANLLRAHCAGLAGVWSTSACPATRRVGRCEVPSSSAVVSTHYYTPVTLDVARTICNQPGWYFIRE